MAAAGQGEGVHTGQEGSRPRPPDPGHRPPGRPERPRPGRGQGPARRRPAGRGGTHVPRRPALRLPARRVRRPGSGPSGAARLAVALAAVGYRGRTIATQAVHDPLFLQEAGGGAEGWLLVSTAVDPAAAPAARAFDTAFRARYRAPAPPYAAEAYDAVHLLARCAQGLGRAQVGRGDLVPTLRGTRYEGVSKAYAFEQANGTYTGDGLFFYEVASGRFRFLGNRSTAWPV
ncbi:ABC transporter substrate-binding protein [Streptomyces sp. NBC_00190]|uniref:ABC transporter substrate-binding protein n=1 Tax=Streptomyces sp. NBC_00190 TaxID=2903634 RepID=UPI003FA6A08D